MKGNTNPYDPAMGPYFEWKLARKWQSDGMEKGKSYAYESNKMGNALILLK